VANLGGAKQTCQVPIFPRPTEPRPAAPSTTTATVAEADDSLPGAVLRCVPPGGKVSLCCIAGDGDWQGARPSWARCALSCSCPRSVKGTRRPPTGRCAWHAAHSRHRCRFHTTTLRRSAGALCRLAPEGGARHRDPGAVLPAAAGRQPRAPQVHRVCSQAGGVHGPLRGQRAPRAPGRDHAAVHHSGPLGMAGWRGGRPGRGQGAAVNCAPPAVWRKRWSASLSFAPCLRLNTCSFSSIHRPAAGDGLHVRRQGGASGRQRQPAGGLHAVQVPPHQEVCGVPAWCGEF
jgi:hypothetical protein